MKSKLLLGLTTLSIAATVAIPLTSCGTKDEETKQHIVQPTQAEKTKTPDAGILKATYNITLTEAATETITATITDEAVTSNTSNFKVPVVHVSGKVCNVTVEWASTPDQDKTCTFTIQLKTSKWTSNITGCSLKYIVPTVVTAIHISGTHNVDIAAGAIGNVKYVITDQDGNNITSQCSYTVTDNFETDRQKKIIGSINSNGALTLSGQGTQKNCTATITVTHKATAVCDTFDIETASFNKLKTDGVYGLVNGYASCTDSANGSIILPTRYFNGDTPVPITKIVSGGMNNDGITWVYISKSISYIGSQAFGSGLEGIVVDSNNSTYSTPTDSNCVIKGTELVVGCKSTVIPTTGINTIGTDAFWRSKITEISIPQNIQTIKSQAFGKCANLTTVTFAGTPTIATIGNNAFEDCGELNSINFPESLKTIGEYAFNGCAKLTTVTFPASLSSIGKEAFLTSGLTSATFTDADAKWIQTDDTNKYLIDISTPATNATNLKTKETGKITGINWATGGINTNTQAVKMAKVVYDEDSFNTGEMTLNSGGTALVDDNSHTITLNYTFTYKDESYFSLGKVVGKNKAEEEICSTVETKFETAHAAISMTISDENWAKVKPWDTITIKFVPKTFNITKFENTITTHTLDESGCTKHFTDVLGKRNIIIKYSTSITSSINAKITLIDKNSTVVQTWTPRLDHDKTTYELTHNDVSKNVVDGENYTLHLELA